MKKKLMFAMAIVACAVGAQAEIYYYSKTEYNGSAVSKTSTDASYYKMYAHSYADVQANYGITTEMNDSQIIATINAYFNGEAAKGIDAWKAAKATWCDTKAQGHGYTTAGVITSSSVDYLKFTRPESAAKNNCVTLLFYTDNYEGIEGFRVAVSENKTASSKSDFDLYEGNAGVSFGAWQTAVHVPEPTSGLLMLLGVAGLALKRKRA